jgi:hypothetical protein
MPEKCAAWEAGALRVTLFNVTTVPAGRSLLTEITGTAPEKIESRRLEGVSVEAGQFLGCQLQVIVTPVRVDIILSASMAKNQAEQSPVPAFVSPGEYAEVAASFRDGLIPWLETLDIPVNRLAFAGNAFLRAGSREAGDKILAKSIKSVAVRDEMRDLVYRVNWRKQSDENDIGYFNRVTVWSVNNLTWQVMQGQMLRTIPVEESAFANVELDINTSEERVEPFEKGRLSLILPQLVAMADEIVAHGEIVS